MPAPSSNASTVDGGHVGALLSELVEALRAARPGPPDLTPFQRAIVEEHAELKRALRGPDVGTPGPRVSSISPTRGRAGSTTVDVHGERLADATLVRIGAARIPAFTRVSDTHLKVPVPAGATTGEVIVFGQLGVAASADRFTVTP